MTKNFVDYFDFSIKKMLKRKKKVRNLDKIYISLAIANFHPFIFCLQKKRDMSWHTPLSFNM